MKSCIMQLPKVEVEVEVEDEVCNLHKLIICN